MDSQLQRLSQLPSLPTVAIRLLKMFADPEVSISDVVFVLQSDPALSGKILKAANTSQFGLRKPVSDLQRAVVLLGKKSVMALALGFSLAEASMSTGAHAHLYSDFWFQSLVRGCAASILAESYTGVDAGEAFTLGLLARIGRLALLNSDTERFVECIRQSEKTGASLDSIEAQHLDVTSMQLSLHLLNEWKLPDHCVLAVDELTLTLDEACSNRADTVSLSDVLRIATAFGEFFSGEQRGLAIAKVYELCCTILGISEEEVNHLVDRIRADLDDHSELFSVDMSKVGSPLELLSQAMGQLSLLAVTASLPREEAGEKATEMMEENGRLRKRVMELTQSSMTDTLTGLFNRASLVQHLQERVEKGRGAGTPVGLLFLDVDHFKSVNDNYGHLIGDEVLKTVATIIRQDLDEQDIATRYGGEEFVILTTPKNVAELQRQAERLRQRIESEVIVCGEVALRITVSIGGRVAVPSQDAAFADFLLEAADSAMYASKRNGRNQVTVFGDEQVAPSPKGIMQSV